MSLEISLHPLVIMNISDQYTRRKAQNDGKAERVVGGMLGTQEGRKIEVYNCFELLFKETEDGSIELDIELLTTRLEAYNKIFPTFEFLGWYSSYHTDPLADQLNNDLKTHRKLLEVNENPLYLVLSTNSHGSDLPVTIYETIVQMENNVTSVKFNSIPYKIETVEAERISVDHVAKNVQSTGAQSAYAQNVLGIVNAVKMLRVRLQALLQIVQTRDDIKKDHKFMRQLNSLCSRLPALEDQDFDSQFLQEFSESMLITQLSTITKGSSLINEMIDNFGVIHGLDKRNPHHFF